MATAKVSSGPRLSKGNLLASPFSLRAPPRLGVPGATASRLDAGMFCKRDALGEFQKRVGGVFAAVAPII